MSVIYAVRRVTKNGKPLKSSKVKLFWNKEAAKQYIIDETKRFSREPYFALYSANAETLFKVLGGE